MPRLSGAVGRRGDSRKELPPQPLEGGAGDGRAGFMDDIMGEGVRPRRGAKCRPRHGNGRGQGSEASPRAPDGVVNPT